MNFKVALGIFLFGMICGCLLTILFIGWLNDFDERDIEP